MCICVYVSAMSTGTFFGGESIVWLHTRSIRKWHFFQIQGQKYELTFLSFVCVGATKCHQALLSFEVHLHLNFQY